MSVIWHDLECGSYAADLPLWRSLAADYGDPVLEIGAGTGRVALELGRSGYRVTALDNDRELLDELQRRADGLEVEISVADARDFELGQRYGLCIVPMQTVQLLGGGSGRLAFLDCVQRHLRPGGAVAIAFNESLEPFELRVGEPAPLPDVCEIDDVVYSSQPTAVRMAARRFSLVRRRETVGARGARAVVEDVVHLDRLSADQLEHEGEQSGLRRLGRAAIPPTVDFVGSLVVILGG
jgi:SAM-dependent methyltransferase